MRWFHHLVPQKDPSKDSLLGNIEIIDEIVVCRQLQFRQFTTFPRIGALYNHLSAIPDHLRCYYEIVVSGKAKLYYDVDINKKDIEYEGKCLSDYDEDTISQVLREVGEKCMESIILAILDTAKIYKIEIRPDDIMLFSSCSKIKESYHLVVPRWYVNTPQHNKTFFDSVYEKVNPKYKKFLDTSVYKRNQQFRMVWSQKYQSNRMKTFMEEWEFGSVKGRFDLKGYSGDSRNRYILECSLISYVLSAYLFDFPVKEKTMYTKQDDVEDGLVHEVASMIPYADKFSLRR